MPQDGSAKDETLPRGTLAVALRNAFESPMPNVDFDLQIVRSTVGEGESRDAIHGTTGPDGNAIIDDLKYGSAYTYRVVVRYKDAKFSVDGIRLDDISGTVALLHLYEPTSDMETAGAFGAVDITVGQADDYLEVNYDLTYLNPGPYALLLDQPIKLPDGHKALSQPDKEAITTVSENEQGAQVVGTLPPGQHMIRFSFHVPLEPDGEQQLKMATFPRIVQSSVRLTASKKMRMQVAGFEAPVRKYDGQAQWLITGKKIKSINDPFIDQLDITISGLPTRPLGAYLALVLAIVATAAGSGYALSRRGKKLPAKETYDDLVEAQRSLLDEFVALERAKERGEIGPKSYARIRQAMLDSLARIVDRLAEARAELGADQPKRAARSRADRLRDARDDDDQMEAPIHAEKIRSSPKKPAAARVR